MKIYRVGGAVRDKLLGIAHQENDWVVVGATSEDMLKRGYRQVGKDFPVFLDPKKNEEYALARKERKTGPGYTGFSFQTNKEITLEEDLQRRDLTINAIAEDVETGEMIDPFAGQADLFNRKLRHVSPAFVEDPVRILRVARFAARFTHLGFTIAQETVALMRTMVDEGEVNALVPERVWKEWERALSEKNPEIFFDTLAACGALNRLFPEVKSADLSALARIAPLSLDKEIRFSVLLHSCTLEEMRAVCQRYHVPNHYRELAELLISLQTCELHDAKSYLDLLRALDAFRREERFKKLLQAYQLLYEKSKLSGLLLRYFEGAKTVRLDEELHLQGKQIGEYLYQQQFSVIQKMIDYDDNKR